ncbi:hypothetical protein ACMSSJ_03350 [Kerstersia gyiorum]|uniref:hypothetical protein n=1 Tax=Kerstersia gyiorum TaxID=206506 RepID=UPI0039EA8D5D
MPLEQKMIDFLKNQPHVDQLDGNFEQPPGAKIADYLFFHKKAVVELKNLSSDPAEKILDYAAPLMNSDEFPLIFGEYDLDAAISSMKNGKAELNKIFAKSTTVIEGVLRQAKKQIASSKKILQIDAETPGILLVLNDKFDSIPANQIANRFSYWLGGGNSNDPNRFHDIDFVIYLQTTYKIKDQLTIPAFVISNNCNSHRHSSIETDIYTFLQAWAQSLGQNYSSMNADIVLDLESTKPARPITTRQDFIEAKYRATRYLKNLPEEQLIDYGAMITERMLSLVIKGKTRPSERDAIIYMTQFTELLEECRLRSFDFKKITCRIRK